MIKTRKRFEGVSHKKRKYFLKDFMNRKWEWAFITFLLLCIVTDIVMETRKNVQHNKKLNYINRNEEREKNTRNKNFWNSFCIEPFFSKMTSQVEPILEVASSANCFQLNVLSESEWVWDKNVNFSTTLILICHLQNEGI